MSKQNIFLKIKETRDAEIARSNRAKEVSKMFWDESQRQLYPNANMITVPITNETLNTKEDLSDAEILAQFIGNLKSITQNDAIIANVTNYLDTEFNISATEYLNANFQNLKSELAKQKKTYTAQLLKTFIKTYLKKNADEIPINQALNPNPNPAPPNPAPPNPAPPNPAPPNPAPPNPAPPNPAPPNPAPPNPAPPNPAPPNPAPPNPNPNPPNIIPVNAPMYIPGTYQAQEPTNRTPALTNNVFKNAKDWLDGINTFINEYVRDAKSGIDPHVKNDFEREIRRINGLYPKQQTVTALKLKSEAIDNAFPGLQQVEINRILGRGLKSKKSKKNRHKTFGSGIASHNIDSKFYVDMKYLNRDQLAVKYKSTQTWVMRPTHLTEPTKKVVMDILLNKLDQKAYDKLNENEKDIIRQFCDLAKIKVCQAYNQEIENLQLKAEVLIGEIKSGNDSKVVKQMLIQAIEMLMKHHGISKIEGLELLNQLKE